ncbi:hypothetical protein PP175_28165 (plasmid) [Aneurinibacillus sp. Ricciae_BoGa-3]|uniref:hypothetical protein n=1 Tax=Aneurinibacillus sp. Ricciae_BoGa-3 TaxID=3022697 RepID=UPI00234141C1|nr:hypothetical protein [Aneurinibacillus sp. Ricciae_BoGa-3]WCK57066.1 hypothetical protein PP175_28165 [Aneurinibacillus sp. Ricciae_BoGa-3]
MPKTMNSKEFSTFMKQMKNKCVINYVVPSIHVNSSLITQIVVHLYGGEVKEFHIRDGEDSKSLKEQVETFFGISLDE